MTQIVWPPKRFSAKRDEYREGFLRQIDEEQLDETDGNMRGADRKTGQLTLALQEIDARMNNCFHSPHD